MAWPKTRCRKARQAGQPHKPSLDFRLAPAVTVYGVGMIRLRRRNCEEAAVYPYRAAEQIVLDLSPQRLNQLLRAREIERYHVDHNIGTQRRDLCAELTL